MDEIVTSLGLVYLLLLSALHPLLLLFNPIFQGLEINF